MGHAGAYRGVAMSPVHLQKQEFPQVNKYLGKRYMWSLGDSNP